MTMTKKERLAIKDAFRAIDNKVARHVLHLERTVAKLDVSERDHFVELYNQGKETKARVKRIEDKVDDILANARFTSSTVEQLNRSLIAAKVIPERDTGYSKLLAPPRRGGRR